jgi:hypothetical protein
MECGTSQNAVAEPETIPAVVEEELVDDVVDSKEQEQWQDTENEVEDEYCEALHDFVNEDTTSFLNFKKGDLICVMLKDPSGWWRGCKAVGSTWSAEAAFPGNYVIPKITKIVSVDKMN